MVRARERITSFLAVIIWADVAQWSECWRERHWGLLSVAAPIRATAMRVIDRGGHEYG